MNSGPTTPVRPFAAAPGRRLPAALALLALAACAPRAARGGGAPVPDPAAFARSLRQATLPGGPRQATFAWSLSESGSSLHGRGAIRYVAPERIRLDLFGPRNESYLAAALVGEEVRMPAPAAEVPLPSPALLWGALGVVRPPAAATLERALGTDSSAELRYRSGPGETLRFLVRGGPGAVHLQRVERAGPSGLLESVDLDWSGAGALARVRYRNWAAYRELTLEMETQKDVPAFPESIWNP